jgi:hypothetical protein
MAGGTQAASAWLTDKESQSAIYQGMTVAQLAVAFEMQPQVVHRRLVAVEPCGRRGRFVIYKIKDAAAVLVEPTGDFEEKIKKMSARDLPPGLTKEFWTALRARQAYELTDGDLWPTVDVFETLAEVFKSIRMSLLLMGDTLERETAFSETQRAKLQSLIDATLESARAELIRSFSEPSGVARTAQALDAGEVEDKFQGL